MKKHLLPCGIFILLLSLAAFSQSSSNSAPTPQNQNKNQTTSEPQPDENNSDLVITANVRARELKVEIVPNPTVEFPGKPARQTVWEADRQNLPEKTEPGVTYRDVGIRLRIYSRFAEIQRIVLEAIDEEQPNSAVTNQISPAETPESKPAAKPESSAVARKPKPKTNRSGRAGK
ncbi:MAG: hypothetical protein M3384_07350 [Acidobacteriota bacterium]|nr:hypothetical protein [Acidobacteriota bacterium]